MTEDLIGGIAGGETSLSYATFDARILNGVTPTWLMKAFKVSHYSLREKLKDAPVLRYKNGDTPVYDLAVAASYLVKPEGNFEEYLKKMKPTELPVIMQKDFWDAQLKKLKYQEEAQELWRTEKVMEVFSITFKAMRDSIRLWMNDLERQSRLNSEQKKFLVEKCDELQAMIYRSLVELEETSRTSSVADEGVDDA